MKNNYVIRNTSTDPYYNLALEEYLLMNYTQGNVIMLWQNDNTIVVGRNQNVMEEINQIYVEENNIKIARRTTGGGAVFHDLGNLNYTIISDYFETEESLLKIFSEALIETLNYFEIEAYFSGRNDVMIGEKKVSGTAQRIYKNRILHHGCILFNSDLEKVADCLHVNPEKFRTKSVKSVRSRVGNISDYLRKPVTLDEFREVLEKKLVKEQDYEKIDLNAQIRAEVIKISESKFETKKWIYDCPVI